MRNAASVFFVLFFCVNLYSAGGVGDDFLRMAPPAKAASIGGAYCAVPGDINTLLFNPSGLVGIKNNEISITHFASFSDTNYEYAAFACPFENKSVLAISGMVDYTSDFMQVNEFGDNVGNVANYDALGILTYAYQIYPWLYIGSSFKLFYSKLYIYDKLGMAADGGAIVKIGQSPDTYGGICVQNIGWQQPYIEVVDSMPVNIKAGISTNFRANQDFKVMLSMDVNRLLGKDEIPTLDLGAEVTFCGCLCMRGGFGVRHDASSMSLGIGVILDNIKFAYAFQPYDDLGAAHRITLDIELN